MSWVLSRLLQERGTGEVGGGQHTATQAHRLGRITYPGASVAAPGSLAAR